MEHLQDFMLSFSLTSSLGQKSLIKMILLRSVGPNST